MEHTAHRIKKRRPQEHQGPLPLLRASATAVGIAMLAGIPLLLIAALFCLGRPDPTRTAQSFGIGIAVLLSLFSGILAARLCKSSPLSVGGLTGIIWILIFCLLSLLPGERESIGLLKFFLRFYPLISATAGAFLGQKCSSSHRKKRRR